MITSKWVFGLENLDEVMAIRQKVFGDELGRNKITDENDDMALHVLVGEDDEYFACGRVYDDNGEFRIGMICVDSRVRGKSLGSLVVRMLINRAFELLGKKVYVDSRLEAVGFYKTLNFKECGEQFIDENGEETVPMVLLKENSPIGSCSGCSGCGSTGGGCSGCAGDCN
jgi:predicted GNAT family N-acyltransferase